MSLTNQFDLGDTPPKVDASLIYDGSFSMEIPLKEKFRYYVAKSKDHNLSGPEIDSAFKQFFNPITSIRGDENKDALRLMVTVGNSNKFDDHKLNTVAKEMSSEFITAMNSFLKENPKVNKLSPAALNLIIENSSDAYQTNLSLKMNSDQHYNAGKAKVESGTTLERIINEDVNATLNRTKSNNNKVIFPTIAPLVVSVLDKNMPRLLIMADMHDPSETSKYVNACINVAIGIVTAMAQSNSRLFIQKPDQKHYLLNTATLSELLKVGIEKACTELNTIGISGSNQVDYGKELVNRVQARLSTQYANGIPPTIEAIQAIKQAATTERESVQRKL